MTVDRLMPEAYQELRRLAAAYLRRERPGQTLQPTALVHEAYLRLAKDKPGRWENRAHFCAIAAKGMRQILAERGITVSVRRSRGRDIRAACGQLITESTRQPTPGRQLATMME